jgi:A/G-specific adenine glycosylase
MMTFTTANTPSPQAFRSLVYRHFKRHGRHTLPWRLTENPYYILVSEIMLQQTQVDRVIPFYTKFILAFPTWHNLAEASLAEVLTLWQGLGYNRRAKLLHLCAQAVVQKYRGVLPTTFDDLIQLPGVGPYTAGAVLAFAFNKPTPIIETNIRTVYLHHYFPNKSAVPDQSIVPHIAATLDTKNPKEWYAALMDYGSYLKHTVGNVSKRSKHHTTQKKFEGSARQVRGAIIRALTKTPLSQRGLSKSTGHTEEKLKEPMSQLVEEGLIMKRDTRYSLPH